MERPAIVSAFGILNIVFAAGHFLGLLLYIPAYGYALSHSRGFVGRMHQHPVYGLLVNWAIPLGLLSIILLVVTGWGLLRLKEWARKLSIAYGFFATLANGARVITNFVVFFMPLLATRASYGFQTSAAIAGLVSAFSHLIHPILLIVFMLRPSVAAAFRPAGDPPDIPQQ